MSADVFQPVAQVVEQPEDGPAEIQSLCMQCHEQGTTRMLLTRIPNFREIIVMAFECPHCHFKNNETQSAGEIAEKGCRLELKVKTKQDLDRQVIKSDSAAVAIPELEFEIPPQTQKGTLTTIEGVITRAADNLAADQEARRREHPEVAAKIDAFLARLRALAVGDAPFTFVLDDPAGRSFIQNPHAPAADPQMTAVHYERSHAQDAALGLRADDDVHGAGEHAHAPVHGATVDAAVADRLMGAAAAAAAGGEEREAMVFQTPCAGCQADGEAKMLQVDIPFFKEVILMCFQCDQCGFRSSEVKCGGRVAAKGTRMTLRVSGPDDLSRDVLKSDTAALLIPELELELTPGTLGGRFTTVEGLLTQVREQLAENSPFVLGDASEGAHRRRFQDFLRDFSRLLSGAVPFTLVLDDPVSNSYLQNLYAPDPDPQLTTEEYERTWDQNEALGLNDLRTGDEGETPPS